MKRLPQNSTHRSPPSETTAAWRKSWIAGVPAATLYFVRSGTIVSYSCYSPRVAFRNPEICKQRAPSDAKSPELCAAPFEMEDTEIVSDEQKLRLQTVRKYGMAINWRWLTASAL